MQYPDEITLREVKVAHQVLVTTLLDHRRVSKDDLSQLYARRWLVELDLRNLKTSAGIDILSCQTHADERETAVGPSTGLQRDSTAHGAGGLRCRRRPAQPELQAHSAALDGMGGARGLCDEGQPAAVHADRPMQSRPSSRTHRAANAKTKAQTLPMVEGAARPRSPTSSEARPRAGDKVSAIRVKPAQAETIRSSSAVSNGPSSVTRESSLRNRWITGLSSSLTCVSL